MNTKCREACARLALVGLLGFMLTGTSFVAAQSKAADLRQQIVGAWTLVNVVLEQGGTKSEPFGPNPKGIATWDANGNFIHVLFRADLPKVASNNRMAPTPEEGKALAAGMLVTYGKYSISDADGSVTMKIEASSFPNWNGAEQKRTITVTGDEMRVINPTPPSGGGTAYVVWRRIK
jgi:hypothetical protein